MELDNKFRNWFLRQFTGVYFSVDRIGNNRMSFLSIKLTPLVLQNLYLWLYKSVHSCQIVCTV